MPDVTIPDAFEIITQGKLITVVTQATVDQIRITDINLTADQAAALARLINLSDGEANLKIEIKPGDEVTAGISVIARYD